MLQFIVNEQEIKTDLSPGTTVLDFLRNNLKLVGTKTGCREGDCGACTILVGEIKNNKLQYQTMTACLMPLANAVGKHIVTIEGVNLEELTPIQQALVDENGTQCGFCTPGFVISLVNFCLRDNNLDYPHAIQDIAGNICRCTGYKSIERAIKIIIKKLKNLDHTNPINWLVGNKFIPKYFQEITPKLEKIIPDKLESSNPKNYIIGGGTDSLIQDFDLVTTTTEIDSIYDNSSLKGIKLENGKCFLGSATTITDLYNSETFEKIFPKIKQYLDLIASQQIRNMATLGGNFANGSPIGDLSIMFMALDGILVIDDQGQKREVPLKDFFTGYKTVDKKPTELIESVYIDIPDEKTFFSFEKISKRTHLDMATVNSAMKVVLDNKIIQKASFTVGGLGPTIRFMKNTCDFLIGKEISNSTFKEANKIAQDEITPRSRPEYKRALVRQQLFLHLMTFSPSAISLEALQ